MKALDELNSITTAVPDGANVSGTLNSAFGANGIKP